MKTQTQTQYFVDRVGKGKGNLHIFTNLPTAIKYFYSHEFKKIKGGKRFIAKETSFEIKIDEQNNIVKIEVSPTIPEAIGTKPYYLIDKHTENQETYCEITSYKTLPELVQKGLPTVKGERIIVRGLELKFEK